MYRWLILLPLFAFFFTSESFAQSNPWKLEKDRDGIKVFTRKNPGSDFNEFKATITITECSLKDALEVLLDINGYEGWFPDCDNPKVLEQINDYHDIHYIETITPWPVEKRFGVYEQKTSLSNNNTKAEMVLTALPNYPIKVDDMVRITEASGKWTLEEVGSSLTITCQFKANPGGNIPAWIANAFVVRHPFETLTNFKKMMDK